MIKADFSTSILFVNSFLKACRSSIAETYWFHLALNDHYIYKNMVQFI